MPANKQSGAALLAFLLIIVTGASYALVKELNASIRRANHGVVSTQSLSEAKNALLGWTISHPTYPGALPMPDRNGDGDYDGGADCYNGGAIGNNLLLGKLPWREVSSPCIDAAELPGLRTYALDSFGEQLWYAVSHNLVYETPEYPFISLALLDKITDWITVRDKNGNVISDRVAFVVIAPGPANVNQDRSAAAPAASNYLDSITIGGTCSAGVVTGGTTYDHSDTTSLEFVIYPDSELTDDECDVFNDQLVFVTIDELMHGLKKRVLSELSNSLSRYHNTYGALPWLTPYFDPKADNRILSGTHTGSNGATSLTDSSADFQAWGVKKGDIVRNVTDGSISTVTVDNNATTLSVTGIHLGTENNFDSGDEYYIVPKDLGKKLDEKADNSSSGASLVDDNQEFEKLNVVLGDIIDNVTDGSSGVVDSVADTTITVRNMAGGADNDFDDNDDYQVRSYTGEATNATDNTLTLDDSHKNFTTMGVAVGDVIVNIKDGSIGRVSATTQTSVTAASLNFGLENDFDDNDTYLLPRFIGVNGTREGLISFHQPGGYFPSAFDVDWSIPELISATANATLSINTSATHTNYVSGLEQYVQTSNGTSGTITVDISDGTCIWTLPEIAECYGEYTDSNFLSGTAMAGSTGTTVKDTSVDFPASGIKRGDKLENTSDVTTGVVSSTTGTDTVVAASISGSTALDFSAGELYRIKVATSFFSDTVTSHTAVSGSTFTITDSGGLPANLASGDAIENLTYGGIGSIVSIVGNTITATRLVGGSYPDIFTTENYRVHYDYVDKRTYTFQTRFRGNTNTRNLNGKRVQDVCLDSSGCIDNSATSGSNNLTLEDTSQNFSSLGITIGDIVHNKSDGSIGAVNFVGTITLSVSSLGGGAENDFDDGDVYEIFTNMPYYNLGAAGTATKNDSVSLEDDSADPNFDKLRIRPGQVVVNTTDGSSGIISTYDSNKQVTVGELNGGTENDFDNGESYYITTPTISIRDYDAGNNELASAAVSIPAGGALGSIKVAGLDYYLHSLDIDLNDDGDYNDAGDVEPDLPAWFTRNKWHQYVYIAYSAGEQPGVATACTAGSDCLVLNVGTNVNDNIRALVMISGEELSGQAWTNGSIGNYFDPAENMDVDDVFEKQSSSSSFNDNIRVAISCPSDATKLCWSE